MCQTQKTTNLKVLNTAKIDTFLPSFSQFLFFHKLKTEQLSQ